MDACTHCGECVALCYFGVRKIISDKLEVNHEGCAGCGLCVDVCPEKCIKMVERDGS
jgi:ferredoxin